MQGQIIEGKEGKPSFKVGNDNHSTEIDLNQLLKQYIGCNLLIEVSGNEVPHDIKISY
tara:strand:+ start:583 stop:756 length:174 start_codon:yes stop_codon:yes gene_type:complete